MDCSTSSVTRRVGAIRTDFVDADNIDLPPSAAKVGRAPPPPQLGTVFAKNRVAPSWRGMRLGKTRSRLIGDSAIELEEKKTTSSTESTHADASICHHQGSKQVVQQEQVIGTGQSASRTVPFPTSHKKSTDPVNEFDWKVKVKRVI